MSTETVLQVGVLPLAADAVDDYFQWMDANKDRIAASNEATDLTVTTAALMKFYFERVDAIREKATQLEEAATAVAWELDWVVSRLPEMKRLHRLATEFVDARTQPQKPAASS